MRGAVARARAVPVGRVCAVYSGWGDVLVSGVFVPRWVALGILGQGVTGCVFLGKWPGSLRKRQGNCLLVWWGVGSANCASSPWVRASSGCLV